ELANLSCSLIYRLDSREFDANLSFHLDKDRKVGLKSYSSLKGCPIWHLSYWSADLLPGYRYYCDPVTICHRIRGVLFQILKVSFVSSCSSCSAEAAVGWKDSPNVCNLDCD
ncbi:unnamed protein product, partial [Musa acuminata subsp. burmannicoides]